MKTEKNNCKSFNRFCIMQYALSILLLISAANSTLLITAPLKNEFKNSTVPYSYANFGTIPYGKTLTFELINFGQSLCNTLQKIQLLTKPSYLLIDSTLGTCSYTKQAINAQYLGAKGIIFASEIVGEFDKVVLADDGNGRKVHISTLFINRQSYIKLVALQSIQIKVSYDLPKYQKVNLTYFLSASGRTNYIFLRDFSPYYKKIQKYINFEPVYLAFACEHCEPQDCIFDNEFCTFQLDQFTPKVGSYIVKEQLNQWNIWKQYGTSKWLAYMNQFDKFCTVNWMKSQKCGNNIKDQLNIRTNSLLSSPTEIMINWRMKQFKSGFISTPEVALNSLMFTGTQDPIQVFEAICASLSSPPEQCNQNPAPSSSHLGIILVIILVSASVSIVLGLCCYRKCIKKQLTKDMFSKVDQLVAKYATKVSQQNKKRKERLNMRLNEQL